MKISNTTRIFIGLVALASLAVIAKAVQLQEPISWMRFLVVLAAALVAARFKVALPKLTGSMSVTLPFILIAFTQCSFAETLIVTCGSVLMQSFGTAGRKPKLIQVIFNVANVANAIGLAYYVTRHMVLKSGIAGSIVAIATAATVYFLANTLPVAIVIGLSEAKNVVKIWSEVFSCSFPYYVVSAGLASMTVAFNRQIWETAIAVLLVAFGLYRSFSTYFRQSTADGTSARPEAGFKARAVAQG